MKSPLQKLEDIASECLGRGISLLDDTMAWKRAALAVSTLWGEEGNAVFHQMALSYENYTHKENNSLYQWAMKRSKGERWAKETLKTILKKGGVDEGAIDGIFQVASFVSTPAVVRPAPPPAYIPLEDIRRASEDGAGLRNHLATYISKVLGVENARRAIDLYFVGSTYNGLTVYPQVDRKAQCHYAKLIEYDPDTGHRIKGRFGAWHVLQIHRTLCFHCEDFQRQGNGSTRCAKWDKCEKADYERERYKQCLFGEHLLLLYPNAEVYVFEAEKDALFYTALRPGFCPEKAVCVAVGSKQLFTQERLLPLKGRKVYVFPDADGFVEWKQKMGKVDEEVRQARGERAGDMEAIPFAKGWRVVDWRADWDKDKKNNSHRDIVDLILEGYEAAASDKVDG